jgi:hypothetical protein
VQAKLPVLNKLNHPFKLLAFVDLYLAIGGGLFLERVLRSIDRRSEIVVRVVAGLCVPTLLLWVAAADPCSFFSFRDRGYPAIPELELFRSTSPPARIANLSPWVRYRGSLGLLPFDVATVHEVLGATGYDPLIAATPESTAQLERFVRDPAGARRAYGIGWITSPGGPPAPLGHVTSWEEPRFGVDALIRTSAALLSGCDAVRLADFIAIVKTPAHDPLAFFETDPGTSLRATFDAHGVGVVLPAGSPGGRLIVNVLLRPNLRGAVDGRPLELEPDAWGRASAVVPAGARSVDVSYEPPFRRGAALGGVLAVGAFGAMLVLRRRAGG